MVPYFFSEHSYQINVQVNNLPKSAMDVIQKQVNLRNVYRIIFPLHSLTNEKLLSAKELIHSRLNVV